MGIHVFVCLAVVCIVAAAGYTIVANIRRFPDRSMDEVLAYLRALPSREELRAAYTWEMVEEWPNPNPTYVARRMLGQTHLVEEYSRRMVYDCGVLHQLGLSESRFVQDQTDGMERKDFTAEELAALDELLRLTKTFRIIGFAVLCKLWIAIIVLTVFRQRMVVIRDWQSFCSFRDVSLAEHFDKLMLAAQAYSRHYNPKWAAALEITVYVP